MRLQDSINIRGIKYMARCPGRWLGINYTKIYDFNYFICEAASGCYINGTGHNEYDIRVFTNLDSGEKILEQGNIKKKTIKSKITFHNVIAQRRLKYNIPRRQQNYKR